MYTGASIFSNGVKYSIMMSTLGKLNNTQQITNIDNSNKKVTFEREENIVSYIIQVSLTL